jgi:hypothetical protein
MCYDPICHSGGSPAIRGEVVVVLGCEPELKRWLWRRSDLQDETNEIGRLTLILQEACRGCNLCMYRDQGQTASIDVQRRWICDQKPCT